MNERIPPLYPWSMDSLMRRIATEWADRGEIFNLAARRFYRLDPDLDLVDRYLLYPPREPDYRYGRSHRKFMGSLKSLHLPPGNADLAYRLHIMLNLRLDDLVDGLHLT